MENPPLWIWGIIIAVTIAGKFIYRWQSTKQFAKEAKIKSNQHIKDSTKDFDDNMKNSNDFRNSRFYKYRPKYCYKDYFTTKKNR
jgi:hypothetical protein